MEKERSFEENFKISSAMLDELITSQRPKMDKSSLWFEEGQIYKVKKSFGKKTQCKHGQIKDLRNNSRRTLVKKPDAKRYLSFNFVCCFCKKLVIRQRNKKLK